MRYKFSDFELDTNNFVLSKFGEPIAIEPQVYELLSYLIANSQRLVTRGELFEQVWPGKIISDTTLSGHIKHVRKALGDSGQHQFFIKAIHGRGYQFSAAVNVIQYDKTVPEKTIKTPENNQLCKGPLVTVMPFLNMSSDPDQRFFAEGMSEDIITELSRFSGIQVLARHSAFQFKDTLGATEYFREKRYMNYLVEGKVRRSNDRVRINIQLIDTC